MGEHESRYDPTNDPLVLQMGLRYSRKHLTYKWIYLAKIDLSEIYLFI